MLKTNEKKLAKFRLQGSIIPPYGFGWEICHDGINRTVPSVGGITLNFKVGDLANQYVADHLEPCVSTSMEPDIAPGKGNSTRNRGYNTFSCIGNEAEVISGRAKGKKGHVTGHHGGCEHVMIDFDDSTLNKLTYDDKILITAYGVGLEIEGFEAIKVFSLDPGLFKKMKLQITSGKLAVPVTTVVPAVVMGSGLGSSSSFKGDYDIQTSDPETNRRFGLDLQIMTDVCILKDFGNDLSDFGGQDGLATGPMSCDFGIAVNDYANGDRPLLIGPAL